VLTATLIECRNALRMLAPREAFRWHLGVLLRLPEVVAGATLAPADRFLGCDFAAEIAGRMCRLHGTDFGVCRELVGRDCYRFGTYPTGAKHVIDLGANVGIFSMMAALTDPSCRVTAVEANPALVEVARRNLSAADVLQRVELLNEIVGDAATANVGNGVQPIRLERFSPSEAIERWGRCDFLKCDIEGSEHSLFDGDLRWLDSVDAMAIEYHWTRADGERLANLLMSRGFRVEIEPRRRLGYLHCRRPIASR
jgi:FkbM family methyltransferase